MEFKARKEKEEELINYDQYIMKPKEKIICFVQGILIEATLVWLFYQSTIMILICSPTSIIYVKYQESIRCRNRRWELTLQFKDGVQALVSALSAGYSVENAFIQAIKDLRLLYDSKAMILIEFEYIVYEIQMNVSVEQALHSFATRSKVEDILSLSEVFQTAKRTGGNLIKILRSTNQIIADKIEVSREIVTIMSAKRFEANIMSLIPVGIILYMWLSSPGFLDPLYHNAIGIVIMTIALIIYGVSYYLMSKIVTIEI